MSPRGFVVDAMLGSLARKLRAFGFDAIYYKAGDDDDLITKAKSAGRVVVTADRMLAAKSERRGVGALLVRGERDSTRIDIMITEAARRGIKLEPGDSRCSVCNGSLRRVPIKEAAPRLPRSVAGRHRLFEECTECHKLYWRGSHWKKLRRLRRRFVEAVSEA